MRILAGEYKGHKILSPPPGATARPMTGIARKSLFDILSAHLVEAVVVDLYCAVGTLGLEALSRGAAECAFADRDRKVLQRLRRNIDALAVAQRCRVWQGDIPARLAGWLAGWDRRVDVAFVDPPYAQARRWVWADVGETIFAPLAGRLSPGGQVILRLGGKTEPPERVATLAMHRAQRYGDMTVAMYHRLEES